MSSILYPILSFSTLPSCSGRRFILSGAGASSLLLAMQLAPLLDEKDQVVLIDPAFHRENDRTFCYWTSISEELDALAFTSFSKVEVISQEGISKIYPLKKHTYKWIRGEDFYFYSLSKLKAYPQVFFLEEELATYKENKDKVSVQLTSGNQLLGNFLTLSHPLDKEVYSKLKSGYHAWFQHFLGWEVELDSAIFNVECCRMFDFRTEQGDGLFFMYVLPTSARSAIVEMTVFSPSPMEADEWYEDRLHTYLKNTLGSNFWRILSKEKGCIPMNDSLGKRYLSNRCMYIGTPAGMAKASTGFAFARMARDAQRLAHYLANETMLPPQSFWKKRFSLYDALLLEVLEDMRDSSHHLFVNLFKRNNVDSLLAFLDEQSSFLQELRIMNSVPRVYFLKMLIRLLKKRGM